MNPNEVKPCAHCGGDAEADLDRFFVTYGHKNGSAVAIYCTACSVEVSLCKGDLPHMTTDELYAECLKIWNRRATVSMEAAQELADCLKATGVEYGTLANRTIKALAQFNREKGGEG